MNFARKNFAREIFNFLFTFYTICAIIGIDNIRKFVDKMNIGGGRRRGTPAGVRGKYRFLLMPDVSRGEYPL